MAFSEIEDIIRDFKEGNMVVMVDDPDRENEGDVVIAAEKVTPEVINFMAKHARGLICLAMEGREIDRLNLAMMTENNTSRYKTGFTVSIEAKKGVTTGISAQDRAHTILTAVNTSSGPEDIVNDQVGLLVPIGDVDALVQSISHILTHRQNYNSARLRAYAVANFAWEQVAVQTVNLYQEVLNGVASHQVSQLLPVGGGNRS